MILCKLSTYKYRYILWPLCMIPLNKKTIHTYIYPWHDAIQRNVYFVKRKTKPTLSTNYNYQILSNQWHPLNNSSQTWVFACFQYPGINIMDHWSLLPNRSHKTKQNKIKRIEKKPSQIISILIFKINEL